MFKALLFNIFQFKISAASLSVHRHHPVMNRSRQNACAHHQLLPPERGDKRIKTVGQRAGSSGVNHVYRPVKRIASIKYVRLIRLVGNK